MPDLSVVIPSHDDVYLHKTIDSLLDNAEGDIEVIPVLDGYSPRYPFRSDPRIRPVRHLYNRGMRESINDGVEASTGRYVMRSDEHCMFGAGYDRILLDGIQDDWIVVPRRFFLDPVRWVIVGEKHIDYEKLLIVEKDGYRKFAAVEWRARSSERAHIPVDETMAFQGSCWVMSRKWWDSVIVRLETEGYGPLYQDTTEMLFKTWRAGGKLMLDKRTWYAHKHREFNRTHHYPIERAIPEFEFALEKHRWEYEQIRKTWRI